jgi:peroxiredoxin
MLKKEIFGILLALLLFSSTGIFAQNPGDVIDDFTLKGTDGKDYKLSSTLEKSSYLVIMFWSTECPFVQAYTDRVNSLADTYRKKAVTFWAINSNSTESMEDAKTHAAEKGYPFPVLKDVNNVIADKLGATRTPEVFLINIQRMIVYHGRIDDNRDPEKVTTNDLKSALDELLSGKNVTVKTTKSFGCTIKRVEDK